MPIPSTEDISSSDVRDEIFSQHERLRRDLAEIEAIADRAAPSQAEVEALRDKAKALYDALATHMAFEESVLPAALRDVIGWGAVIQRQMEEDHARQRETLTLAISAIGPLGLSGARLIENIRSFASTLLVDMESEEEGFRQADVDAIAGDTKGG